MSAKRNPIIADLRPHMDGLIQTRPDMLQREADHWAQLITWALETSTPVKRARFYGFRVSSCIQLIQAHAILTRIAALPVA